MSLEYNYEKSLPKCNVCGKKGFFLETNEWENHGIVGLPSKIQGCKECSICSVCDKKYKKETNQLYVGYGPKFYCEEHQMQATNLCSRCGQEKPNIGTYIYDDEIICKDCGKCVICGKSDKTITRLTKGSPIYCQEHKDSMLDKLYPEKEHQNKIEQEVPIILNAETLEEVTQNEIIQYLEKLHFEANTIEEIEAVHEKMSKKFIFKDITLRQRENLISTKKNLEKIRRELLKPSKLDLITSLTNPAFATNMSIKQNTLIQDVQRQINEIDEKIKKINNEINLKNKILVSPEKKIDDSNSDSFKILKMRLAKGEITKEEYEGLKKTLQQE